jgi:hypothetical protein
MFEINTKEKSQYTQKKSYKNITNSKFLKKLLKYHNTAITV